MYMALPFFITLCLLEVTSFSCKKVLLFICVCKGCLHICLLSPSLSLSLSLCAILSVLQKVSSDSLLQNHWLSSPPSLLQSVLSVWQRHVGSREVACVRICPHCVCCATSVWFSVPFVRSLQCETPSCCRVRICTCICVLRHAAYFSLQACSNSNSVIFFYIYIYFKGKVTMASLYFVLIYRSRYWQRITPKHETPQITMPSNRRQVTEWIHMDHFGSERA